MSVTKRFKSYFFRGFAVLLPTVVTIWIFLWIYKFTQNNVSIYINRGLVRLIMLVQGEGGVSEADLDAIFVEGVAGSIVGFLIALAVVIIVGALLASMVGRAVWRVFEKSIMKTPLLKRVYPYVKQITDFVLTPEEQARLFSKVVAVEYPRKGVWSIGFVTGSGLKRMADDIEKEILTILIPTSPTPVTGYIIMVPKEQTIALDVTIEEAFRFIISAGVIAPDGQRLHAVLPLPGLKDEESLTIFLGNN